MLELCIYLAISAVLIFSGYVVSVFSNTIYIDPEEIQNIFPELSAGRRRRLEKLITNPRAFVQVAFLVRVSAAIAVGIFAWLIARSITRYQLIPSAAIYVIVIGLVWAVTLVLFIYLPRHLLPLKARSKLVRFLPLVNLIYVVSAPVIAALNRISARRAAAEIPEDRKDDIVERAIETLAESAGISSPIIEEDEKEMIHQIFQLDVTEVEEIMIPRVSITGIEASATLDEIRKAVETGGYSRYPVYEGSIDNIIGIINVKDLLILNDQQRRSFTVTDHIREPLRVGEHKKIDQLLADFKRTKIHMAIVIDEFGGTAGLVTLEDILEEIVGEIEDEHDPEKDRDIAALDDGTYEVSGALPLDDLAEALGFELEEDEFQTVGGLIYDMVGSVPSEGVTLAWKNCRLKVVVVEGQRIKKVLVIPNPANSQ